MKKNSSKTKRRETALLNLKTAKGPVTPEGKRVAAMNALRHGLDSTAAILPHLGETAEAWQAHVEGVMQSLSPANYMERCVVEQIACALWQFKRLNKYRHAKTIHAAEQSERQALDNMILGSGVSDPKVLLSFCQLPDAKSLAKANGHEVHIMRMLMRLGTEFRAMQSQREVLLTETHTIKNKKSGNEPIVGRAQRLNSNSVSISKTLSATRRAR